MIIETIIIPEEISKNLERLNLETESHKSLLAFMIEHNIQQNDGFYKYEAEFKALFKEYDNEKRKLQQIFIDPILKQHNIPNSNAYWNLDFSTQKVTISTNE